MPHFTKEELNTDLQRSLAVAKQRRATFMASGNVQTPIIAPDRMQAAVDRRNQRRKDAFGELPVLPTPSAPVNSNGDGDGV